MAFGLTFSPKKPRNPYGPPGPSYMRLVVFFGLGFIGFIIILLLLLSLFTDHSKDKLMTAIGRIQFLTSTITDAQKHVQSADLAKVNSDALTLFAGDTNILLSELKTRYGQSSIDANVTATETDTNALQELNNGMLLNKYDVTYRDVLTQKIDTLGFSLPELRDSIGTATFKASANKIISDLKVITNEFDQLSLQ